MTNFLLKRGQTEDSLAQLQSGLDKQSLADNFLGFEWSGTIAASTEVPIRNALRNGKKPRGYLVTSLAGSPTLLKGDTEWTSATLYLKNSSATDALTATVFFFF